MRPQARGETVRAAPPTRILIVDDHEVSRAALTALLHTEGFEVADVRTDDDPIDLAVAFDPAVALVDVTPERRAGFETASELRALTDPPAVVLTSSAERRRFGSRLEGQLFVAKADLCGAVIIAAILDRLTLAGQIIETGTTS